MGLERVPAMGNTKLTERQAAVLSCIRTHMLRNHYAPTIREIGDEVGLSSTSSVKYQLDTLADLGYLRRDTRRPRTMATSFSRGLPRIGT